MYMGIFMLFMIKKSVKSKKNGKKKVKNEMSVIKLKAVC